MRCSPFRWFEADWTRIVVGETGEEPIEGSFEGDSTDMQLPMMYVDDRVLNMCNRSYK